MTQASAKPPTMVEIGRLTRVHGLRGELFLEYYADSPEWLDGEIWLKSGEAGEPRPAKIVARRFHRGQLLVRLEGIADRSAAEHMRGMSLLIPESLLPESEEDSYYLHHLLGLEVVLDADGSLLGTLVHVDFIGEQEMWVIESPKGHEILFPAVPQFVDHVNLEDGIIRVTPPEGLLELYAEPS